jgi:hypothetical protein
MQSQNNGGFFGFGQDFFVQPLYEGVAAVA